MANKQVNDRDKEHHKTGNFALPCCTAHFEVRTAYQ